MTEQERTPEELRTQEIVQIINELLQFAPPAIRKLLGTRLQELLFPQSTPKE